MSHLHTLCACFLSVFLWRIPVSAFLPEKHTPLAHAHQTPAVMQRERRRTRTHTHLTTLCLPICVALARGPPRGGGRRRAERAVRAQGNLWSKGIGSAGPVVTRVLFYTCTRVSNAFMHPRGARVKQDPGDNWCTC